MSSPAPAACASSHETEAIFIACQPLFFALGDAMRQQLVGVLASAMELNVTQIAERLPLSRPAISHHLKILRQAGLVEQRKAGTERYYRLTLNAATQVLKRFVHALEQACNVAPPDLP